MKNLNFSESHVAIFRDQIVLLHFGEFETVVEYPFGICFMQCELGPESAFEIIGEF